MSRRDPRVLVKSPSNLNLTIIVKLHYPTPLVAHRPDGECADESSAYTRILKEFGLTGENAFRFNDFPEEESH